MTVVATAVLAKAGAGAAVLEAIPVMAELELQIQELEVAVLVVVLTVLHMVELGVAVLVLGDKVLQELQRPIVPEKVDLEEKAGRLVKILGGATVLRCVKVETMVVVVGVLVLPLGVDTDKLQADEAVFVLYGDQDESSQILRQEICNDSIL